MCHLSDVLSGGCFFLVVTRRVRPTLSHDKDVTPIFDPEPPATRFTANGPPWYGDPERRPQVCTMGGSARDLPPRRPLPRHGYGPLRLLVSRGNHSQTVKTVGSAQARVAYPGGCHGASLGDDPAAG